MDFARHGMQFDPSHAPKQAHAIRGQDQGTRCFYSRKTIRSTAQIWSNLVELALFYSIICVLSRSSLSLIDRVTFAHKGYPLLKTHFLNTAITFSLSSIGTFFLTGTHGILDAMLSMENLLLATLMHAISMSISFAFKQMNVSDVSIITKSADIFIPLALVSIAIENVDSSHYFQLLTGLIILPLLFRKKTFLSFISLPGALVVLFICLQSLALELFDFQKATNFETFAVQVTGILFWRSVLGTAALFFAKKKPGAEETIRISTMDLLKDPFLISRPILMLINYASFVLAIAGDHKGLVWAVLNSTGLVSIFLAHRLLKEKMGRPELVTFSMIIAASSIYYTTGGTHV
jgi:hypothetical protein